RSKLLAEQHVLAATRDRGLPAVIVRPGILVGQDGPGIDALNALVIGRQLVLLGDAAGAPPLISTHDAAELIVRAGSVPALGPGAVAPRGGRPAAAGAYVPAPPRARPRPSRAPRSWSARARRRRRGRGTRPRPRTRAAYHPVPDARRRRAAPVR